jgi:carbon-monoxide dehydrogenase large subunit
MVIDGGNIPQMLQEAAEQVQYEPQASGNAPNDERGTIRRGVGFATYVEATGLGPFEGALVQIQEDGTVLLHTGASSQGQGHATVFAQICADALGVRPDTVKVLAGDTGYIRYGWGTIASRSAVVAGNAIAQASTELRSKVLEAAGLMLEVDSADLVLSEGRVHPTGSPDQSISLAAVARAAEPGPKHGGGPHHGLQAECYFETIENLTWASGVHAASVEVDVETGVIKLLRYVVVHDPGRMINPKIVEGQVLGGVVQGIGAALMEELIYDDQAQLATVTLADYMIPTASDLPRMIVEELPSPSHLNPLGVKGVGEGGTVPGPAVIANAVEAALADYDVVIDRTPITPPMVLSLLGDAPGRAKAS